MNEREIDVKTQVLLAIYAEYQRRVYDMARVDFHALGLESDEFRCALIKLDNEGLIRGLIRVPPGEARMAKIQAVIRDGMLPTERGIALAEEVLETQHEKSAKEKLIKAARSAGLFGLECLKAFLLERVGQA